MVIADKTVDVRRWADTRSDINSNKIVSQFSSIGTMNETEKESGQQDRVNFKMRTPRRPRLNTAGRSKQDNISSEPCRMSDEVIEQRAVKVVQCLRQFGMAVIDKFMGQQISRQIRRQAEELNSGMKDGLTLFEPHKGGNPYRLDKIAWVNGSESNARAIDHLVHTLDVLVKKMREQLTEYHIEGRTQAMVACYPGKGTNYVRHVDNPYKDGRILTCIYYLNESWAPEDGGVLRVYPGGKSRMATVEPILDRLLIFWSDSRTPHEVMPAYKKRYAITVWYFDKTEREMALNRLQKSENLKLSPSDSNNNITDEKNDTSDERVVNNTLKLDVEKSEDCDDDEINVVDVDSNDIVNTAVTFNGKATPRVDVQHVVSNKLNNTSSNTKVSNKSKLKYPKIEYPAD